MKFSYVHTFESVFSNSIKEAREVPPKATSFFLFPKKWRQMSKYLPPLVSFQLQGLLCKPHFNSSFIPANTVSNSKQNAICIHDCAIYFFKSSLILASEVRKNTHMQNMLDSSTLFKINNKNNNFLTHFGTNIEHSVLRRSLWDMSIYHRDTTLCIVAPRYTTILYS